MGWGQGGTTQLDLSENVNDYERTLHQILMTSMDGDTDYFL